MARIVKLNVGGTLYTTSVSNIMQYPDSMLGLMIQQQEEQTRIQEGKELFVDRNGQRFEYVLEYLRNGDHVVLPEGVATLRVLLLEADFFQLGSFKMLISKELSESNSTYKVGDIVSLNGLSGFSGPPPVDRMLAVRRIGDWFGTVVGFAANSDVVAVKFTCFAADDNREISAYLDVPLRLLPSKK